jgi:hypothetical protein
MEKDREAAWAKRVAHADVRPALHPQGDRHQAGLTQRRYRDHQRADDDQGHESGSGREEEQRDVDVGDGAAAGASDQILEQETEEGR